MSRSRTSLAALAAAIAAAAPATARADDPKPPQGDPVDLPVLDLQMTVVSLDGSIAATASEHEVTFTLAADVLFAFDKAALAPAARSRIAAAAARIRKDGAQRVKVEGYTDSKGSDAYNLDLSKRRAATVAGALRGALGGATSFQTAGRGEAAPVAPNTKKDGSDNPSGRAKNRRVTVTYAK